MKLLRSTKAAAKTCQHKGFPPGVLFLEPSPHKYGQQVGQGGEGGEQIGHGHTGADGVQQVIMPGALGQIHGKLPHRHQQHGTLELLVAQGQQEDIADPNTGLFFWIGVLLGQRQENDIADGQHQTQHTDGDEDLRLIGRALQRVCQQTEADERDAGNDGGGKLLDGEIAEANGFFNEIQMPNGVAAGKEVIEDAGDKDQNAEGP